MDPVTAAALVTGLARLLTVAVQSGIELTTIVQEARDSGDVPPERWDTIMAKLAEGDSWISAELKRRQDAPPAHRR